jgi:hypothetical protein
MTLVSQRRRTLPKYLPQAELHRVFHVIEVWQRFAETGPLLVRASPSYRPKYSEAVIGGNRLKCSS